MPGIAEDVLDAPEAAAGKHSDLEIESRSTLRRPLSIALLPHHGLLVDIVADVQARAGLRLRAWQGAMSPSGPSALKAACDHFAVSTVSARPRVIAACLSTHRH
jgi:hypothetical protein